MRRRETAVDTAVEGIDRLVRNVEHGRFERTLSGLTAAGALVTAAARPTCTPTRPRRWRTYDISSTSTTTR